jgi:hypothetical protein
MSLTKNCIAGFSVISVLAILIFPVGCSDGKTTKKNTPANDSILTDSSYLFNGKTLEGWEITNFGPQGPVSVSGNQIILGMGDGCTGITWKGHFPETQYEVDLDAKRVAGNDFFCGITFPVRKKFCSLIIGGWGGATVGLSSIDGKDAAENETTSIRNFETGRWYHIRLVVTDESIKSWIDSAMAVDFKIENKNLSIRPEVSLSRPFGIASWNTTAAIRNIRLHVLKNE